MGLRPAAGVTGMARLAGPKPAAGPEWPWRKGGEWSPAVHFGFSFIRFDHLGFCQLGGGIFLFIFFRGGRSV